MKTFHLLMFMLTGLVAMPGCQRSEPPPADVAPAAPAPDPKDLKGAIRFDDAWLKVVPFVVHQAQMDIATGCLNRREDEIAAGNSEAVLCYDRLKRDREAIRTIRIETGPGAMRDATGVIRKLNESAHFIVERGGSVYQILDTVYPARRDGAYRPDEVRVIATGPDGAKHATKLAEELVRHFPGSQTTSVEIKP